MAFAKPQACLYKCERRLRRQGYRRIAGVDEVGVGCLAGPVMAAAVVLPPQARIAGLHDSKRLTPAAREKVFAALLDLGVLYALGSCTPAEIDQINIYRASQLAMQRALAKLGAAIDFVLVDHHHLADLDCPQQAITHGDAQVACIAAASIVAKVSRDRLMVELAHACPGYGFSTNKGYPSPKHLLSLQKLGPSRWHRHSFAPVQAAAKAQTSGS